ncbi:MAG: hypothetical protein FWG64_01820 [Firmicutes bacterium]|nr:hypothetical protein [Bacillota bacterium]
MGNFADFWEILRIFGEFADFEKRADNIRPYNRQSVGADIIRLSADKQVRYFCTFIKIIVTIIQQPHNF